MKKQYEGRTCFVTGAARGIGKACAEKFALLGSDLILVDLNQAVLENTAQVLKNDYGCKVWTYSVDISDFTACDAMMEDIQAKIGTFDMLANCAGIAVAKCLIDATPSDWERVINVDLRAIWYLSQLFAKQLIASEKKRGHIVSISSQASKIGEYANGVYSIAKAGINSLTQVLGLEFAEHGISVTAICPGYVNTEMVQEAFQTRAPLEGKTPEQYEKELTSGVAMGRMCEPPEVANLMAFLAGGDADYITGVTVTIAGGKTLV